MKKILFVTFMVLCFDVSFASNSCEFLFTNKKINSINNSLIKKWLDQEHKGEGLKVEIAAAHLPLCNDCLQIDRFVDSYDYRKYESKLKGKPEPLPDPQKDHDFVVKTRGGIVADARELPLSEATIALMFVKHLPWARGEDPSVQEFIREVFNEAYRTLRLDGKYIVLVNGDHEPSEYLKYHIMIAQEIGFVVSTAHGVEFSGLVLTKGPLKDDSVNN